MNLNLEKLSDLAAQADGEPLWPTASWNALQSTGALTWIVPKEHGGTEMDLPQLVAGYRQLASACLTTTFLLSQRDAAVRRLRDGENGRLRDQLLPQLARGECFATVGLSQLTTSRQHGRPALRAQLTEAGIQLNGIMPWVSGADHADYFVTGAALDDGRQVLIALPRLTEGVDIGPPLDLMALQGSRTAEVRCRRVQLSREWLLAGPAERVMQIGKGGTGGLETSALALGLAQAGVAFLHQEAAQRPEWLESATSCQKILSEAIARLDQLAREGGSSEQAGDLRASANTLALRVGQLALAAAKGAGFVRTHPAQRWARQALFFLVWSCPRPALEATVAQLQPPCAD